MTSWIRIVFGLCLMAAPVHAEDGKTRDLIFERAEIVAGGYVDDDAAYLTIWNGGSKPATITKIRALNYSAISLVRVRDAAEIGIDKAVLTIPSKSEIVMSSDTVFLALKGRAVRASEIRIELEFDNGTTLAKTATLHVEGEVRADHHHGMGN